MADAFFTPIEPLNLVASLTQLGNVLTTCLYNVIT